VSIEKERSMQVVDLNAVQSMPIDERLNVAFPVHSGTGCAASAAVWMEIAPGGTVQEHTDSAEELLYVARGEVEATIGDETGTLGAGELAVVPAMALHSLRNVGDEEARVLGFFAGSANVATFTAPPHGPGGPQIFVIGGPMPIALPLEAPVTA
jgi:quercetin dioxygenase-like cupin family protein